MWSLRWKRSCGLAVMQRSLTEVNSLSRYWTLGELEVSLAVLPSMLSHNLKRDQSTFLPSLPALIKKLVIFIFPFRTKQFNSHWLNANSCPLLPFSEWKIAASSRTQCNRLRLFLLTTIIWSNDWLHLIVIQIKFNCICNLIWMWLCDVDCILTVLCSIYLQIKYTSLWRWK